MDSHSSPRSPHPAKCSGDLGLCAQKPSSESLCLLPESGGEESDTKRDLSLLPQAREQGLTLTKCSLHPASHHAVPPFP